MSDTYNGSSFSLGVAVGRRRIRLLESRVVVRSRLHRQHTRRRTHRQGFSQSLHIKLRIQWSGFCKLTSESLCLLTSSAAVSSSSSSSAGDSGLFAAEAAAPLKESSARPLASSLGLLVALGVMSSHGAAVTELLAGGEAFGSSSEEEDEEGQSRLPDHVDDLQWRFIWTPCAVVMHFVELRISVKSPSAVSFSAATNMLNVLHCSTQLSTGCCRLTSFATHPRTFDCSQLAL